MTPCDKQDQKMNTEASCLKGPRNRKAAACMSEECL